MAVTIDALQIEIQSSSKSAADGINALAESLKKLKSAMNVKGIEKLKTAFAELQSAIAPLSAMTGTKLSSVAKGMADLANAPKISAATIRNIKMLAKAGKELADIDFSALSKVSSALSGMGGGINNGVNVPATDAIKSEAMQASNLPAVIPDMSAALVPVRGELDTLGQSALSAASGIRMLGDGVIELTPDMYTIVDSTEQAAGGFTTITSEATRAKQELKSAGDAAGDAGKKLKEVGTSAKQGASGLSKFVSSLKRILMYRVVRSILSNIASAAKEGIQNLAQYSAAIGGIDASKANATMSQFASIGIQVKNTIGSALMPVLNALMPVIQTVANWFVIAANAVNQFFAALSGASTWSKATEGAVDYAGGLGKAAGAAKKLANATLGIDELNIISPDAGGGGGGGAGALDYGEMFEEVGIDSKIKDIADKIKPVIEWIKENFDAILDAAKLIGATILLWKVGSGLSKFITGLTGLSRAGAITIGVTLAITGFTIEFTGIKDAVQNGLNEINFAEILTGGLLGASGAAVLGAGLAVLIDSAFGSSAVALAITQAGINLGTATVAGTGAAILGAVGAIIAGIPMYFTGIYDAIMNGLNWLSALLIPAGATLAGAGIGAMIGAMIGAIGGPAVAGIGAVIGLVVGLITDFTIWFWQKFDEIEEWFTGLPGWAKYLIVSITAIVAPILLVVAAVVTLIKKWDEVKEFLSSMATWFYENVVSPIVGFFTPIFEAIWSIVTLIFEKASEIVTGVGKAIGSILAKFKEVFLKLVEIAIALGGAFYTYVIKPVADAIASVANLFYEESIKPVIERLSKVGKWVYDNFISPIVEKFVWLRDKAIELFKEVGTTVVTFVSESFKAVINGILAAIESTINMFLGMLNGAISIINKIPGVNITKVELLTIPRLADGGFVNEGQMFIAREAGPEMVGSIGNRTAVANNDQIVEGIREGVYDAVVAAMARADGGENASVNVYLDGKQINASVRKTQREKGAGIMTGGVVFA